MTPNPFAPTFGATPPVLAGRADILTDIDEAFETGPTHPDYTTVFIGVRGAGITEAKRRIGRLVLAPTWKGLSGVDPRFLIAMARDETESMLSDITARLVVDTNYAGVYRHRLINAGMITATGKGRIEFAHHATREWRRGQPAYVETVVADD